MRALGFGMSVRCRQCGKLGTNVSAGFEVEFSREIPWTVIDFAHDCNGN